LVSSSSTADVDYVFQ